MAGIYCADIYCDACINDIKSRLWAACDDGGCESRDEWEESMGYDDERNYDSDEYPKWCDDDEESDSPQHCGSHGECLDPYVDTDGEKYGYFFGNTLTAAGEHYVIETVREDRRAGRDDSIACTLWADCYSYLDFSEECDDA